MSKLLGTTTKIIMEMVPVVKRVVEAKERTIVKEIDNVKDMELNKITTRTMES